MLGWIPHPPAERWLVAIFGLGWTLAAVSFWIVREREGGGPLGWLWPVIFGAAAIATLAFAAKPSSRGLHVLSGALSFLAVLSRAAAVGLNLIYERGPSGLDPAYAVIGLVVYPLFAVALLYVWDVGFGGLWLAHHDRGASRRGGPGVPEHPRS